MTDSKTAEFSHEPDYHEAQQGDINDPVLFGSRSKNSAQNLQECHSNIKERRKNSPYYGRVFYPEWRTEYNFLSMPEPFPDRDKLEERRIYVKIEGNKFYYKVIDPLGEIAEGKISAGDLKLPVGKPLTQRVLDAKLPNVLEITFNRGHTVAAEEYTPGSGYEKNQAFWAGAIDAGKIFHLITPLDRYDSPQYQRTVHELLWLKDNGYEFKSDPNTVTTIATPPSPPLDHNQRYISDYQKLIDNYDTLKIKKDDPQFKDDLQIKEAFENAEVEYKEILACLAQIKEDVRTSKELANVNNQSQSSSPWRRGKNNNNRGQSYPSRGKGQDNRKINNNNLSQLDASSRGVELSFFNNKPPQNIADTTVKTEGSAPGQIISNNPTTLDKIKGNIKLLHAVELISDGPIWGKINFKCANQNLPDELKTNLKRALGKDVVITGNTFTIPEQKLEQLRDSLEPKEPNVPQQNNNNKLPPSPG